MSSILFHSLDKHILDSPLALISYLTLYTLILVFIVLSYLSAMLFYYVGTQRASRSINAKLVDSVLGSTLRSVKVAGLGSYIDIPCSSWLDETPTSRIVTRCTQDIATVDGNLYLSFGGVVEIIGEMLTKLGGPVLFTPIFLLPGVLIAFLGVYIGNIYLRAQMSVKREKRQVQLSLILNELEVLTPTFFVSNAKSPVLAHFGAAIAGLGVFFFPHIFAFFFIPYFYSIYPGVWCSTAFHERIDDKN